MDPPIPTPAIRAVDWNEESEGFYYCKEVDEFDSVLFGEVLFEDWEEFPDEEFDDSDVLFDEFEELLVLYALHSIESHFIHSIP